MRDPVGEEERVRRLAKIAVALAVFAALSVAAGVAAFYAFILNDLPEINKLVSMRKPAHA